MPTSAMRAIDFHRPKLAYDVLRYTLALEFLFAFFLVHLKFGWFVVGHGYNGVEYAVVIAAMCLAAGLLAPRRA